MARYCNYSTETPRFERCINFAEPGGYRCSEHLIKKQKREGDLETSAKIAFRKQMNFECAECGGYAVEIDHIIEMIDFAPEDRWMANLPSNLQLLCYDHHLKKTANFRKSRIDVGDPNDRSTTARNRKKKRMRSRGFYY